MKRVNLLTKFTVLFGFLFILLTIVLAKVIVVSNETLIVALASSVLVFLFSILFIYKEIKVPLMDLYQYSGKLKLPENLNEDDDDFDKKSKELNELIDDLDSMKSGRILNKEIYDTISELTMIARRTLHEINTAKVFRTNRNEFMGNVAHELRTPIFAIQLSLETLLDGAISDEEVNMDFLTRAMNQTKRLKELVDDLISIAKFETGVKMSMRYFPITKAIREIVMELSGVANTKEVSLTFANGYPDDLTAFGDEQRLRQVLINLIDNSIKYTPRQGNVKISLDVRPKDLSVIVSDNGIGIPKKDLPRIFERFYRVDKARSRDIGGSGLGLSIVKHILEAHSSPIKVESEVDKGTRFEFTLKR